MLKQDFKTLYYMHAFVLITVSCVIWGLAMTNSPHLEGVSVYRMSSALPIDDVSNTFPSIRFGNRSRNTFITEAMLMPSCVFPLVYNTLDGKTSQAKLDYLINSQGMSSEDAAAVTSAWNKIDFSTWDNPFKVVGQPSVQYNMPYNLPYDGLDATKSLNPQYFSPICRCINGVLDIYLQGKGSLDNTTQSLQACTATRHIIQRQTLVGNDDPLNSDLTTRKYISRHALLFNLCTAVVFTIIYNMIEFDSSETTANFYSKQLSKFFMLLLSFLIPYLSQIFSLSAVSPANSIQFSSIVYMPAAAIFLVVEWMWSHVAKEQDIRRQTYLHPYSFYVILVNLHVIALIENGVFTLEVILTFVFLSNIIALAYTAVLFTAHGKLWQGRRAELTGYILILFLVGISYVFHYIPVHPVNSELSYLWVLPMVFVFFCFTQIVVLEHLMGEDSAVHSTDSEDLMGGAGESSTSTKSYTKTRNQTLKFTNSVHLLNLGHSAIITLVILYYAAQVHYTWYGDMSFTETGGKLDRRLNFELAELLDTPSYNNLANAPGSYLRST